MTHYEIYPFELYARSAGNNNVSISFFIRFFFQSHLDKHMQEHRDEQEGTKTYPCKQCNLEFTKLTLLREHMKQHYKIR